MIERREKWRRAVLCLRLSQWAIRHDLPWRWFFEVALAAMVQQYRVGRGPWQSYTSQAHLNAVRLFHGEEVRR